MKRSWFIYHPLRVLAKSWWFHIGRILGKGK